MNIFILDEDIETNVKYHADVHVRKMLLESVQILSTVYRVIHNNIIDKDKEDYIYKLFNPNHPCCLWVRESIDNYLWMIKFTDLLGKEFEYRFEKPHKSYEMFKQLLALYNPAVLFDDKLFFQKIGLTPYFYVGSELPQEYIVKDNVVETYRNYYRFVKSSIKGFVWSKRDLPGWL